VFKNEYDILLFNYYNIFLIIFPSLLSGPVSRFAQGLGNRQFPGHYNPVYS